MISYTRRQAYNSNPLLHTNISNVHFDIWNQIQGLSNTGHMNNHILWFDPWPQFALLPVHGPWNDFFFMFELCIFEIFFMNIVSCANPFSLYICGKQKLISISYKAWVRHLCEFYCKFIKHHSYCKYFHLLSINLHIHQICFYIALKLSPVTNRKLSNIMSIFF